MNSSGPPADGSMVVLGRVVGVFGTRGWIKVRSYSRERAGILRYRRWRLATHGHWAEYAVMEGRAQGRGVIVRLTGVADPAQARALVGADIAVPRAELPAVEPGAFYWADLEGLRVVNLAGAELGRVDYLFETGANDVMVIRGERERLIPCIKSVVREVDVKSGVIRVDWDADF